MIDVVPSIGSSSTSTSFQVCHFGVRNMNKSEMYPPSIGFGLAVGDLKRTS
jgi:hypothetical protein